MVIGDRAELEAGQAIKRGLLTFRSSLKMSAVAVKCGMTFLQCGHPAREGERMLHMRGRLLSQEPLLEAPERPFQELLSTQQTVGFHLTPTACIPPCQGPCINPAPQTTVPCICCWQEGFVGVPVQAAGSRLTAASTSHPTCRLRSTVTSHRGLPLLLEEPGAEGALCSEEADGCSGFSEPVTRPRSLAPVTMANLSIS